MSYMTRRNALALPFLAAALVAGCTMNASEAQTEEEYAKARARMVHEQLAPRGVRDERVLAAMGKVPRHELVPAERREYAYEDRPLPIGYGQTISQPYVVAAMSEAVLLTKGEKVLEVGTGSGYQAAVLAEIGAEVYTIELEEALAKRAAADLARLGYRNVHVRHGDGYRGWPEEAPFDAIVVTAAPDHVPQPLIDQLAPGGHLVIPVGKMFQELVLLSRDEKGEIQRKSLFGVRFVPMRGEAEGE
jgi:protein-L-isoaspartate(D-aspartate) O-methyltransferase